MKKSHLVFLMVFMCASSSFAQENVLTQLPKVEILELNPKTEFQKPLEQIKKCYREYLQGGQKGAGEAAIDLHVNKSRKVDNVTIKLPSVLAPLKVCIEKAFLGHQLKESSAHDLKLKFSVEFTEKEQAE